jgi:hypothetical protein
MIEKTIMSGSLVSPRENMKLAAITLILACCLCQSAWARFIPSYTFEELMKMSDLVVLMEHEATLESEARDPRGGSGRVTTAKILAVLKGESEEVKLTIHHFFYASSPQSPNHVTFPPAEAEMCSLRTATPSGRGTLFVTPTRRYLAFLKKQENGSCIPVTPQFDSNASFMPVGGHLNRLWMTPHDSGLSARTSRPKEIRVFVEVEPDATRKTDAEPGANPPAAAPESESGAAEQKPQAKPELSPR